MRKERTRKNTTLVKNLSIALIAQVVSLLSSFAIQFFAPKVLDVKEFAYWQLFLFYVSYINVSRIGIIDGMYLRLGGEKRKTLNNSLLKTEYIAFMILQLIASSIMALVVVLFVLDKNRLFVIIACSICMIIINSNNYFGFLFQAINETSVYSISEVIYNMFWFLGLIRILVFKTGSFYNLIVFYMLGQLVAGIYLMYKASFILSAQSFKLNEVLGRMKEDAMIGMPLLVSMYASMLITGASRFIVDHRWGIESFGYFSFAMSLTTFVLKFISQISMVLFPALRSVNKEDQIQLFTLGENALAILLPMVLIMYVPVKLLVSWWIPQYESSLTYFGVLLPICVFDGKMQLLYSTYLKVLRKEKHLLLVNVLAVSVSVVFSSLSAYVLNNLEIIAWGLLAAILLRSIVSENMLSKWMGVKKEYRLIISEFMIVVGFALLSSFVSDNYVFIIYFIIYVLYCMINIDTIKKIWRFSSSIINR